MKFGIIVTDDDTCWGGEKGVGEWFKQRFETRNATKDSFIPIHAISGKLPLTQDIRNFDGFILTGSHHSVNEKEEWIEKLMQFIRKVYHTSIEYGFPKMFGMCFGHQIIAKALGGKVGRNPSKEFYFGSTEITVEDEFFNNAYARKVFGKQKRAHIMMMKFHGECVLKLPPTAKRIGTSAQCANEILKYGNSILSTQGHPEYPKNTMVVTNANIMKRLGNKMCMDSLKDSLKEIEEAEVDQMTDTVRYFLSHRSNHVSKKLQRQATVQ